MRSNLSKSHRRSEYVPISRRIYKWEKSFVSFLPSSIGRKGSEVTRRQKKKVFVAHYKSPSLISSDIVSSFFFSSEARTTQEGGEEKGDLIYCVTGRGTHSYKQNTLFCCSPIICLSSPVTLNKKRQSFCRLGCHSVFYRTFFVSTFLPPCVLRSFLFFLLSFSSSSSSFSP